MTAGDIFWAKHGRIWYPAKVCTQNEIPEHVLQKLTIKHPGQPICKMVGGGQLSNVEQLVQNKVDEHRAPGSAQIAKAHHSGLSEVIDI